MIMIMTMATATTMMMTVIMMVKTMMMIHLCATGEHRERGKEEEGELVDPS